MFLIFVIMRVQRKMIVVSFCLVFVFEFKMSFGFFFISGTVIWNLICTFILIFDCLGYEISVWYKLPIFVDMILMYVYFSC